MRVYNNSTVLYSSSSSGNDNEHARSKLPPLRETVQRGLCPEM